MQKLFTRLAISSAGGRFETVSEISHRTGMDIYVLKSWMDQLADSGDLEKADTPDGVKYRIAEGKEGDI